MKKKYIQILLCIAFLILFSVINYNNLKFYCDQIFEYSGFVIEEKFEEKLKKENELALENEREYQQILEEEDNPNLRNNNLQTTDNDRDETPIKKEDLKLHAISALLLDATNNRVLYEENGFNEMPMASTTKIMTCIVTLENANLQDVVTVSSHAARMPDVQLNINTGEQYYLKDLLYSLMLESHNDSAVAIAEHVGGSVEGFAKMMNEKAKELGCNNTNFVTPNGLDAQGHYTTARDLAMIASYAIKNKQFISITNTSAYQFREIKKGRGFHISNKNRFLYMMDGAIGVKTGFTNGAGYCFVGAVKRTDRTLVSVVLGSGWPPHKTYKWTDTKELMSFGIQNFKNKQIFEDKVFEPILVKDGQQRYVSLQMEGDIKLLISDDETVHIEYDIPEVIQAPVEGNSVIGHARYYIDNNLYTEIPVYTTTEVAKINYKFCLRKIINLWSLQQ